MSQPIEDSNFVQSTSEVFQPDVNFSHKEPEAWQPEDDNPEENIGEEVEYDLEEEIPPNAGSAS